MAVQGHELFRSPSGQLFVVKQATLGEYSVIGLIPNYVRRYPKKYLAVKSIESGHCDPPPKKPAGG